MDDFELFRARALHGGVLGVEHSQVERFDPACRDRRQEPTCRLAAKFATTRAPKVRFNNLVTEDKGTDCRSSRSLKFWARQDDVIAIPEVVRCSNAWVDFSATELPVKDVDRDQKSDRWYRSQNAWMSCCERSVVGVTLPDEAATHEFDVYRLRSFATAAGRIVNRGDFFRVRQRVYPTANAQLEHLRGPFQTVSGQPVKAAATPSNSSPSGPPPTIEYRPVVYYASINRDAADDGETAVDVYENDEEDFSDERTRLLADRGRQTSYFRRKRYHSQSGADKTTARQGSASTDVPDNDAEQSRVTSTIRVVVLGDRGVGKTTLARQLLTSEHLANYPACSNLTQGKSRHR